MRVWFAWVGLSMVLACGGSSPAPSASLAPRAPSGRHALSIAISGSGDIRAAAFDCRSSCLQSLDPQQAVHLEAVPDAGWRFDGWNGDCNGALACDLSLSADRSVSATFSRAPTPLPPPAPVLTVKLTGDGGGRVTSAGAGLDCPGTCAMPMPEGVTVQLLAQPDAHSTFLGFGGDCSGLACSVDGKAARTVWADFKANAPPDFPCAGIASPAPAAMQQHVVLPGYQDSMTCGGAVGDAAGTLGFLAYHAHVDVIDLVRSASGASVKSIATSMGGSLFQQPSGVTELSGRPYLGPDWALRYGQMIANIDSTGAATAAFLGNHGRQNLLPAAADPQGGVLVAGDLSMGPTTPVIHAAVLYTGGAAPAAIHWGPVLLASAGSVLGVGVDLLERSFVITDGSGRFGAGAISAQWFDARGSALSGEFALLQGFVAGLNTWFEAAPMPGGGLLIVRRDGDSHAQALVILGSGQVQPSPAPGWMAARRDVKFQLVESGKAWAALPLGATGASCTQRLEIVAPDGTSCATADYPIASGTCDTFELKLAADGTVIQQLPTALETTNDSVGGHTCTWRWWAATVR